MKISKKSNNMLKISEESKQFYSRGHDYRRNSSRIVTRLRKFFLPGDGERVEVPLIQGIGECHYCGDRPIEIVLSKKKGEYYFSAMTECDGQAGFVTFSEINIPTGKLIVTDSINFKDRQLEEEDRINIGFSYPGQAKYSEWLKTQNIAYSQLGDGSFYICKDKTTGDLYITDLEHVENTKGEWKPLTPDDSWEIVGEVSMGRFTVFLTSKETYDSLHESGEWDTEPLILDIEPGEYTYCNYATSGFHELHSGGQMTHGILRKRASRYGNGSKKEGN